MTLIASLFDVFSEHKNLSLVLAPIIYAICLAVYRLTLHPLAHVPGPKLAAATQWYEFYYDVIKKGTYTSKIGQLHKQYGPVIRISPNELHCNDPEYIDEIYAGGGKKRDKSEFFCYGMQFYGACINTADHDHHRLRRAPLSRFFSKAAIVKLEPLIRERISELCNSIESYAKTGTSCNLSHAFSSLATDIIEEYCFGISHHNVLKPSFLPNLHHPLFVLQTNVIPSKHFPWLLPMINLLPDFVVARLMPDTIEWLRMRQQLDESVEKVLEDRKGKEGGKGSGTEGEKESIFTEILKADLPPQEKSRKRLRDEAYELVGAGTETVAWTLSIGIFYLLHNPSTLSTLLAELRSLPSPSSSQLTSTTLESLPYLSSVIQESLRLTYGVSTRLQRVPHESLAYSGHFKGQSIKLHIPPRTAIGMSNYLVHHNEDVFEESHNFKPERWLDENGRRKRDLDGYLLAFSRGSRVCLGMNLAHTELFLTIAIFVLRFGERMELHETTLRDVEWKYDNFGPGRETTDGVRVLIK